MRIPTTKIFIRPLQAAVVLLAVSNIVITILWIVQCQPISGAWADDVQAQCFTRAQLIRIVFAQAIISAVSDFAFAAMPILVLWRVQMKMRDKMALCLLMGLGTM